MKPTFFHFLKLIFVLSLLNSSLTFFASVVRIQHFKNSTFRREALSQLSAEGQQRPLLSLKLASSRGHK